MKATNFFALLICLSGFSIRAMHELQKNPHSNIQPAATSIQKTELNLQTTQKRRKAIERKQTLQRNKDRHNKYNNSLPGQ